MKEGIFESGRVKIAITGILLEGLILFAPVLGLEADPEMLKIVAGTVAAIIVGLIWGRSYRNTPSSSKWDFYQDQANEPS